MEILFGDGRTRLLRASARREKLGFGLDSRGVYAVRSMWTRRGSTADALRPPIVLTRAHEGATERQALRRRWAQGQKAVVDEYRPRAQVAGCRLQAGGRQMSTDQDEIEEEKMAKMASGHEATRKKGVRARKEVGWECRGAYS